MSKSKRSKGKRQVKVADVIIEDAGHIGQFPLSFMYEQKGKRAFVYVPVPTGYPLTKLHSKVKKHTGHPKNVFLYLEMSKDYLHYFYNFAAVYHGLANNQEKTGLKGFGKRMWCFAIKHAVQNGFIKNNQSPFYLFAAGADANCDAKQIALLRKTYTKDEAEKYIQQYPQEYKEYLRGGYDPIRYMCWIQENVKLVAYYKTLGFDYVDVIPAQMKADYKQYVGFGLKSTITKVLSACSKKNIF